MQYDTHYIMLNRVETAPTSIIDIVNIIYTRQATAYIFR